jgi:hypothetical protein
MSVQPSFTDINHFKQTSKITLKQSKSGALKYVSFEVEGVIHTTENLSIEEMIEVLSSQEMIAKLIKTSQPWIGVIQSFLKSLFKDLNNDIKVQVAMTVVCIKLLSSKECDADDIYKLAESLKMLDRSRMYKAMSIGLALITAKTLKTNPKKNGKPFKKPVHQDRKPKAAMPGTPPPVPTSETPVKTEQSVETKPPVIAVEQSVEVTVSVVAPPATVVPGRQCNKCKKMVTCTFQEHKPFCIPPTTKCSKCGIVLTGPASKHNPFCPGKPANAAMPATAPQKDETSLPPKGTTVDWSDIA